MENQISRLVRHLWREIQIAREDIFWLKSRFGRSAKWLADENIDLSIIEWMRSEGMNVRTASELGFKRKDDREIFALARKLNRMIITGDKDFWDDSKFPVDMSPGIIIISQDVSDRVIALELLNLRDIIWPYGEVWDKSKIKLEGSGKVWVKSRVRDTGKITTMVYWVTNRKVYEQVDE